MKRFLPWLILFSVLLVAIPVLVVLDYLGAARILGVVVVLGFSVAVRIWLLRSDKLKKKFGKVTFNTNDIFHLERLFPAWKTIPKKEKKELTRKMSKVIVKNVFDNYDHTSPSRDDIVTVSLVAAIVDEAHEGVVFVMHRSENPASGVQDNVCFFDISAVEHILIEQKTWPLKAEVTANLRQAMSF